MFSPNCCRLYAPKELILNWILVSVFLAIDADEFHLKSPLFFRCHDNITMAASAFQAAYTYSIYFCIFQELIAAKLNLPNESSTTKYTYVAVLRFFETNPNILRTEMKLLLDLQSNGCVN
jgi:hypothetical protein